MQVVPVRAPRSPVIGPAVVLVAVLMGAPARADDADAKLHYQKATAHFAIGEYREAAAEYEEAFKIKQDPALLFDAAQSHRLGGDNQRALLQYKNVVKLYPGSTYARDAQDRIEKLEQAMAVSPAGPGAASAQAQPAPSVPSGETGTPAMAATEAAARGATGATAGQPVPGAAPSPPTAAASGPPVLLATAPAAPTGPSRPVYARWWFWTGVGAVVATGIVVAVLATRGTTPWANLPDVHGAP